MLCAGADWLCTLDHKAVGYCAKGTYLDGGNTVWAYGGLENCLVDSSTGPPSSAPSIGLLKGHSSRCYQLPEEPVPLSGLYFPGLSAGCFDTSCASNGSLYVHLHLAQQVVQLPCPSGERAPTALCSSR